MNLPEVIIKLVKTQNNFESTSFANCFTESASVFDEGQLYNGKNEIKNWIEKAINEYQVKIEPLDYSESTEVLKVKVTGIFPGSPATLFYHLELKNKLIQSLKISS